MPQVIEILYGESHIPIVKIMVADDLVMQGTRRAVAMVLI